MAPKRTAETRRLKMADIARMSGVSISTVSRALAGSPLIPEQTREMIAEIARNNGYVVNPFARGLRMKRTQTIGVAIPLGHDKSQLISDPFFLEILGHLADEVTLRGYDILLSRVASPQTHWLDQLIQSQRTDGLVIIGQSDQHGALNAAGLDYEPLVVWGARLADQTYCSVGLDNELGGYMATHHLLSQGRRHIAFLGDPGLPEIGQRHQGYLRAYREAGLTPDPRLDAPAHFTSDLAGEAAEQLLASGVELDGVFAASDFIAMVTMIAVNKAGRSVPRDVAVVGFDDSAIASHASPPLTTVRQDLAKAAKIMIDLLFKKLDGQVVESVQMPPELIVRQSSGAA